MHQSLQGATFHVEHVIPRVHGGLSDSSNLALACPSCNLHKADRTVSRSYPSAVEVAYFNPRTDVWTEHFEWDDYILIGRTEVGRVTIRALDLNHERRIRIRQAEQLFGLFPPDTANKQVRLDG
jgi:hypothetical protein